MWSERNTPKNGEPTVGFSFTTMLQHTGRFWSKVSEQKQCDNTGASSCSPDLAPADFYLFSRLNLALDGPCFCDATDIMKNATEELKRPLQNYFP